MGQKSRNVWRGSLSDINLRDNSLFYGLQAGKEYVTIDIGSILSDSELGYRPCVPLRIHQSAQSCSHSGFCIFVMFSTFRDEMQYVFLEKSFNIMVFVVVKDAGTDVSLTAKKTMKMKFFSKKIYCISSRNVLNITNMQNPK